jgi:hypothetical protein
MWRSWTERIYSCPAQGVLAIQIRASDTFLEEKLQVLHHPQSAAITGIERKLLQLFHGGCHMPVGAYATHNEETGVYALRAARSESWDKLPVSIHLESKNPDQLASRVFEKLKSAQPCQVFISRNKKTDDYFVNALEANGFQVTCTSLIDIVPVPFQGIPETGWIFFASRHAVKHFFSCHPNLTNQKIGLHRQIPRRGPCVKFNRRRRFHSAIPPIPNLPRKQFAARVGNDTVLFPQAKGSLRSVQAWIRKKDQVTDLIVYETIRTDNKLPSNNHYNILVFTSPSNAEAFLEKFNIRDNQSVVAMGDAHRAGAEKDSG